MIKVLPNFLGGLLVTVGALKCLLYYNMQQNNYSALVAGAAAGLANWTLSYPIDERQLCYNIDVRTAIRGCPSLWVGYPICAVRAVLVNGAIFASYDTVNKWLAS